MKKSGDKLTLPPLFESKSLSFKRSQSQRSRALKADELYFTLHENTTSQIPLAIHNTMGCLRSRHFEVSHWQAQSSTEEIEREITCVKQVKTMVERCLQERWPYSQIMSDCVDLSSRLCSAGQRQDEVFITLRKEEQMTNESIEFLQKQIPILDDKLRFHQTTHLLDILNQRPRIELCLDQSYNALSLERKDLEKMAAGLQSLLQHSQQKLAEVKRLLNFVEDKLASNAQTLEVAERSQSLHQSMWPSTDTAMCVRNTPKLYRALDGPSSHTDHQ